MKLIGATLLFAYAVSARRNKNNKKKEPQQYNHTPCNANSHAVTSLGFANGFTTDSMLTPNYPQNYGDFECVQWTVSRPNGIPDGSIPTLVFNDFDVEEGYDFLYIYTGTTDDAANEVAKLDGTQSGQLVLPGDASDFYFKWDSDFSYSLTGFDIYVEWQAPPPPPSRIPDYASGECSYDTTTNSPTDTCGMIKIGATSCACVEEFEDKERVRGCECDIYSETQKWEFVNGEIRNGEWCWTGRPNLNNGEKSYFKIRECKPDRRIAGRQQFGWDNNTGRMYYQNQTEGNEKCVYAITHDADGNASLLAVRCHNDGEFNSV